jgi:hypothetical protein
MSIVLVKDITIKNNPRNYALLRKIKEQNLQQEKTSKGEVIVRTRYSNCLKFVKALLTEKNNYDNKELKDAAAIENVKYSNTDEFNVKSLATGIEIDFALTEPAKVSLSILDLSGTEIISLLQNKQHSSGDYHYTSNMTKGLHLVKYVVNGNINIKKIVIH